MTRELMEKLLNIVYNSKELKINEKIELYENINLFLRYYEQNMSALQKIADENKKRDK